MRKIALIVVVLVGGVVLWISLRPDPHRLPGTPSVVVLTIDTLRADAVGPGKNTPAFDRFFATATRFTRARTVVPLTVPSHLSLLSGLQPNTHGIPDNATAGVTTDRGYPLLAEEFRAAGYATAAFVAADVLGRYTGLDAGFDVYDAPEKGEIPADERLRAPLEWLGQRDGPFFLWVHFFDPHWPYEGRAGDSPRRLYAQEVARVDRALARLLDAIPEDAIVVVATDHGEGLFDHNEPTHGLQCWATTIDMVLAVRSPALAAGAVDTLPRSICDVAPTLRAWCGLDAPPCDGLPLFHDEGERVVVSETLAAWREYGWGQVLAATDGRFTLIESGEAVRLYDIAADSGEKRPLQEPQRHAAYESLDRALTAYRQATPPEAQPIDLSNATAYGHARVHENRYLSRGANARLADPGRRFGILKRYLNAVQLAATGNAAALDGAVTTLEKLCRNDPQNPAYHYQAFLAMGARARLRKDPALARAAVRRGLQAVARGYTLATLLGDLCDQAVASQDETSRREVLNVAFHRSIAPDLASAKRLVALAKASGKSDDKRWREHLAWVRAQLPPADAAQLGDG